MWTYTAYFLQKYLEKFPEKRESIEVDELAKHLLYSLWEYSRIRFQDSVSKVYDDLEWLEKLNVIAIQKNVPVERSRITIKNRKKLEEIAENTKNFAFSANDLLQEYIKRIDNAIEKIR